MEFEASPILRDAVDQLTGCLALLPPDALRRLGESALWLAGQEAPRASVRHRLHALRQLQDREGVFDEGASLVVLSVALEEAAALDMALAARHCHGSRPGTQFFDLGQRFLSSRKVGIFSAQTRDDALRRGDLRVAGNFSAVDAAGVGLLHRINIWSAVGKAESAVVLGLWAPGSHAFSEAFIHPYGRRGLGPQMPSAQDQLTCNWMTACLGQLMLRSIGGSECEMTSASLQRVFERCVDDAQQMASIGIENQRAPVLTDVIEFTPTQIQSLNKSNSYEQNDEPAPDTRCELPNRAVVLHP